MRSIFKFLSLATLASGCIGSAFGATINAVNPSSAAVQSAINTALDGDTVMIPAGSATWTTQVVLNNKGINIVGAGIDQTIIIHGSGSSSALYLSNLGGKFTSVSRMTMVGSAGAVYGVLELGNTSQTATNWRIHHMRFSAISKRGIFVCGKVEGVIDHCTFEAPFNLNAQGVTVWGDSSQYLPTIPAGSSWNRPLALGTSKLVYIEDCIFDFAYANDAACEGYVGARFVFRYNSVTNSLVGCHGLDSSVSSTHSYEIYKNNFTFAQFPATSAGAGYNGLAFYTRGGTGVYYDNKIVVPWLGQQGTAFVGNKIELQCYRATGTLNQPSMQGGFITGTNPYDGNSDSYGWLSCQQVGATSPLILTGTNSIQTASPFYQWNNTSGKDLNSQSGAAICVIGPYSDATLAAAGMSRPYPTDIIKKNRDYYDNVVHPTYRAFVYPHPLVAGTSAAIIAPANLRVVSGF
jgi:hypothetical protein